MTDVRRPNKGRKGTTPAEMNHEVNFSDINLALKTVNIANSRGRGAIGVNSVGHGGMEGFGMIRLVSMARVNGKEIVAKSGPYILEMRGLLHQAACQGRAYMLKRTVEDISCTLHPRRWQELPRQPTTISSWM